MSRHERLTRLAITLVAAALVAACGTQTSTSAPSPSSAAQSAKPAASPATATSTQQPLEVTGKFALTPARGPWDTKVTATASGLRADTKYDLVWTTAAGA